MILLEYAQSIQLHVEYVYFDIWLLPHQFVVRAFDKNINYVQYYNIPVFTSI
jgi:hypothetical protein